MVVTDAPWVVGPAGVVTPVPIVASGVLAPDPFVLANAVAIDTIGGEDSADAPVEVFPAPSDDDVSSTLSVGEFIPVPLAGVVALAAPPDVVFPEPLAVVATSAGVD